jgi:[protein-PII] uridylyltransferase
LHHTKEAHELKERAAAMLAAAREEYAVDARHGRGGRQVLGRYADRLDGLVRQLTAAALSRTAMPVAVCAVGGYGRGLLCLHSDIDLLIVFDGAIGRPEERFVNALLQPLWDLRLSVGQHVRELQELAALDTANPEFGLASLDVRRVAGDEALLARVVDRSRRAGVQGSARLLQSLKTLIRHRHAQFADTFYQLEPDIKNAPGALRDIAAVRVIRRLTSNAPSGQDEGAQALVEAEDRLLRIRSLLHLESGRDMNLLTHELQEKIADALGCIGEDAQQRVEALMSVYFREARAVTRALSRSMRTFEPPACTPAARPLNKHLEIGGEGIRFTDPARAASMPAIWLEAFRLALTHRCGLAEESLDCIERHAGSYTEEDFVTTEGDRHQLRHLLRPRPGLYARLSDMHECWLLGRIFPEFEKVHSRVVRDFYHRYTVDEHTLLAIRNIERLAGQPEDSRDRFAALLGELHAPELLVLALLFHDVGKWRGDEHVEESARLVEPALDRLQLPDQDRRTVVFLIRNHLAMSRVAFRRDPEDPEVVARFASLVGSEDQLKMLTLLTLADVGAVAPDTLTPWKEELLWRLYVDAYNHLTLGYADELIQKDPAGLAELMTGRPDDISEAELSRFLDGLPRRYLALFGLSAIYHHVRLARGIGPARLHASLEKHDEAWELTVVTEDRPWLFSNVAGVLSYFGMDIHRGQVLTTPAGLVLDVFEFTDEESFLARNPTATAEITRTLEGVVAGTVDVAALLARKERSVLRRRVGRVQPLVHVDNEHSRKYTVLEIVAADGPGLLHRISHTVSSSGYDIDLALISTEGKTAIDVLHITAGGRKLSGPEQTALKQELEATLEGRT